MYQEISVSDKIHNARSPGTAQGHINKSSIPFPPQEHIIPLRDDPNLHALTTLPSNRASVPTPSRLTKRTENQADNTKYPPFSYHGPPPLENRNTSLTSS
jgi:hypothetical protein